MEKSVEEKIIDSLNDPKNGKKMYENIKVFIDGYPVNKEPIEEMPIPEMTLYYIDDNAFDSIEGLLSYCRKNMLDTTDLNVIEYYREFAGRKDVIRKSNSVYTSFYTAVDEHGYGTYNRNRSFYKGEFVWEYNYGSIKDLYKYFRDKGVEFEDDVYKKISEREQYIIKCFSNRRMINMSSK